MDNAYQVLASVHDELGMGDYGERMTPQIFTLAQQNGWFGRQVMDLGCGTGASLTYLARHGYISTGVDYTPAMIELAQSTVDENQASLTWVEQDIRQLHDVDQQDLVLSLETLCELKSLRELETVFKVVYQYLRADKWFIFNLHTIEGLIQRHNAGDMLIHDAPDLMIVARNSHSYEKQIQRRTYTIFRQGTDDHWSRQRATRVLRAYPIQGVTTLIKRCGFEVLHVYNDDLALYKPDESTNRVLIIAQKS
jgi:2-polyprenyl-3-methyl-5-hydroxy-6-metoxy-1,4-benzoquinol methylase